MNIFREALLNYIRENPGLSIYEISQALDRTPADIRYHVHYLLKSQYIQSQISSSGSTRGRPSRVFTTGDSAKPSNYLHMSHILLTVLCAHEIDQATIANQITQCPLTGRTPPARYNDLVERLSQMNYEATWEARKIGPMIIFHNCPYASLRPQHTELCDIDHLMLEQWLGKDVITLTTALSGNLTCQFLVKNK